ncbi:MAG: hypothetical protein DRN81_02980 [Thermoproteota archaeon]|nr:MAG: hypothetical protein DRN81_02980 [Candidatus Korarchaeota archaeon]
MFPKILLATVLCLSCGQLPQGEDGDEGKVGKEGKSGKAGSTCGVIDTPQGAVIQCDDGTSQVITDGNAGTNGIDGTDGNAGAVGAKGNVGEQGSQGVQGIAGTDGKDFTPVLPVDFEGYWVLPNGGYIELIENADQRVLIYGSQRILSTNYDGGLAIHPPITAGPHFVRSTVISGIYNYTYSSSTHDLERDGETGNITGTRLTKYTLSIVDGKLVIELIIYSSNGHGVEATRTIVSY